MFSTAVARATSPVRVCVDTPRGTHMVRGHLTLLSVYVASENADHIPFSRLEKC